MSSKTASLIARANAQPDSESSVVQATRAFLSAQEATEKFAYFKKKLLGISDWDKMSLISYFELHDHDGKSVRRAAEVGDFVKIYMPGSGKYDWVSVISIDENSDDKTEEIVMTVRPSFDPTGDESGKSAVSHFFTDASTNNFCLVRRKEVINLYVIGLDEKTNTRETGSVLESARNLLTANLGHFLGIQHKEWKTFCQNLLEVEERASN